MNKEKIVAAFTAIKKMLQAAKNKDFYGATEKTKSKIQDHLLSLNLRTVDNILEGAGCTTFYMHPDIEIDLYCTEEAGWRRNILTSGVMQVGDWRAKISIDTLDMAIEKIEGLDWPPVGILNTSILTTAGEYTLTDISLAEAKEVISGQEIDSAVGHQPISDILTELLETEVPFNRQFFQQQPGQKSIVFKLLGRPEEGKVLSLDEIEEMGYKFQLLERVG